MSSRTGRRNCKRKHRYGGRAMAQFFARKTGMRAYACGYCHGWHLTSRVRELNLGHGVKVWV